jgi:pSer/pThr/pTyr-binding forkhead associated (FHA) protein
MVPGQTDWQEELLTLPDDAPRIRITAGVGTAGQKSWHLRRPVTLLGCGRRAHIVLRGPEVARAHAALINTGSAVLLKDLHTKSGTQCNGKRIDLTVLRDGDLVQIGSTPIQVAIQSCRSTAGRADEAGADPLKLDAPLRLRRPGVAAGWLIDESCAVIGRAGGVAVRLEHEAVSDAHALLFDLDGQMVLFDLASEMGTFCQGRPVSLTRIGPGDRLRVGTAELAVGSADDEGTPPAVEAANLDIVGEDLNGAWHQINDWHASSDEQQDPERDCDRKLADRGAELDRLEARLRGRLHDLTGHREELAAREKELQSKLQSWEGTRKKIGERTAELEQLQAALALRERQLTARELRLNSTGAAAGASGREAQ